MRPAPEDLAEFWGDLQQEAAKWPLDYRRSVSNEFELPGFIVNTLAFSTVGGRSLHGWIAYPEGARRLKSFLWVPPYGRESLLPNQYGTREGMVSLSFNFFGHEPFHQETYVKERGYFAQGAESPDTWIFGRMYQDAVIASRVLQAQIEVDEDAIGAMGMSQGGGMSIWLGAWNPIIKAVCADMPFLGGIGATLQGTVYRYPTKELVDFMSEITMGEERVQHTLSYFDTVHQAAHCKVPTRVSLGLKDPAAKPAQVRAIYEALPGPKELTELDWGHDWSPEMVEPNRRWLQENL